MNRGTAGPAELVASAIQDNQRGDIVGDKTFGEGSVQKLIEVPDGSALILSVAKYYTPNGKVIQDTGITPNVLVASTDDIVTISDDDDNTTTEETPEATQPKEDEQLRRAIEVLKNEATEKLAHNSSSQKARLRARFFSFGKRTSMHYNSDYSSCTCCLLALNRAILALVNQPPPMKFLV